MKLWQTVNTFISILINQWIHKMGAPRLFCIQQRNQSLEFNAIQWLADWLTNNWINIPVYIWTELRNKLVSPLNENRVSEWLNRFMVEWENQSMNEWINKLVNKGMNKSITQWINKWMNECKKDRITELINEWNNERIKWMNEPLHLASALAKRTKQQQQTGMGYSLLRGKLCQRFPSCQFQCRSGRSYTCPWFHQSAQAAPSTVTQQKGVMSHAAASHPSTSAASPQRRSPSPTPPPVTQLSAGFKLEQRNTPTSSHIPPCNAACAIYM